MLSRQTRRRFLTTVSLAGAAGLLRPPAVFAAEERLETTQIRLGRAGGVCPAPLYIADELLRAEGFTDIRFVDTAPGAPIMAAMGRGEFDFGMNYVAPEILAVETGDPITMIAG